MSNSALDLHKIENYLIRLGAIAECVEVNGDDFLTDEVRRDVNIALDFIKTEFGKMAQGKTNE